MGIRRRHLPLVQVAAAVPALVLVQGTLHSFLEPHMRILTPRFTRTRMATSRTRPTLMHFPMLIVQFTAMPTYTAGMRTCRSRARLLLL